MNYGYAKLSHEKGESVELNQDDEYERFPLQMYELIGSGLNTLKTLKNQVLLEVGSGRGGGLEYLTRTKTPAKSIGVDFSQIQVDFCNQAYS